MVSTDTYTHVQTNIHNLQTIHKWKQKGESISAKKSIKQKKKTI